MAESIKLFTHPEYDAKVGDWITARDLYEGNHEVLTSEKYLWPHHIERGQGVRLFQARGQRTRYLNLSEILCSIWVSQFYKSDPDLAEVEPLFDVNIKDVDGAGTSLGTFIQEDITLSFLNFGKVIALVQASAIEGTTAAEVERQGARPFVQLISPLALKDWAVETQDPKRMGRYNFIRFEEIVILPRVSPEEPVKRVCRSQAHAVIGGAYTVTIYECELDDHGNLKCDSNKNPAWEKVSESVVSRVRGDALTEIPVVIYETEAWLKDANQESIRYHNLRSRKDNIEHFQMYQEVFYKLRDPENTTRINALGEGARTVLGIDEDMGAIAPVDASGWADTLTDALLTTFRVGLNQARSLPMDSKAGQSSDSIGAEREHTTALVKSTIGELEDIINQIVQIWASFTNGAKEFEGKIKLSRNVEIRSADDAITQFQALEADMRKVPIWIKTELKKWANKFGYTEDEAGEIVKAIESTSFTPQTSFTENRQSLITNALNGVNGEQRNGAGI